MSEESRAVVKLRSGAFIVVTMRRGARFDLVDYRYRPAWPKRGKKYKGGLRGPDPN